jgi:arabinogalactan endo-1,4-beta-galactosidase
MSGYPLTPEGAASLMRDIISITASLPHGRGEGVFWWNALDRGGRAPFGMFDRQGNALDVVNAYRVGRSP